MMTKQKKWIKLALIALIVVAVALIFVGAELVLNVAVRARTMESEQLVDRTDMAAVALGNVPVVKTVENNFAAAVLWTATFKGRANGLSESKIAEENNTHVSEPALYSALDKYMPNGRREQLRNLSDKAVLQKVHESLSQNRPLLSLTEDGQGGAKYVAVIAFDPIAKTVGVYDFELGEVVSSAEEDFLLSLKFQEADGKTACAVAFGKITLNALMIIY